MKVRVHKKCLGITTPIAAFSGYFYHVKKAKIEPVDKYCVKCMKCGHSVLNTDTKLIEKERVAIKELNC